MIGEIHYQIQIAYVKFVLIFSIEQRKSNGNVNEPSKLYQLCNFIIMALNTPHTVTLTEGQIGVILCSLEKSVKYADSEYIEEVDTIFNILEGSVDKYYDKMEKAKKKQPDMEW